MKGIVTGIFLLVAVLNTSRGQTWQLMPNSPEAEYVNDDVFFVNQNKGWMVNLDGFIYRTQDAGNSWDTMIIQPGTAFRCIGFADSLHGFAGNLGPGSWISNVSDTHPLYETNDGGVSWNPVVNITGTYPSGVCGMRVVDDSVIYAVGRYDGPCVVLKTIDGGAHWTSTDMSNKFDDLIDVWFFSRDTGVIVGGRNYHSVIYYTSNGGSTWQKVFQNVELYGWHWKVNFPSRNVGYSSIEGGTSTTSRVAKTTDGGLTWHLKPLIPPSNGDATGIGFINDSVGWVGCWIPGEDWMTTDGGDTWTACTLDPEFNRFRKINDTTAYICGSRIWKYTGTTVTNSPQINYEAQGYSMKQNEPNPFTGETTITYTIPKPGFVTLRVFDMGGRTLETLVQQKQQQGTYTYTFSLPKPANASFVCKLDVNGYHKIIKMLMIKE